MIFVKNISQLCTPAYLYFIISIITLFLMVLQNIGNKGRYSIGIYSCSMPSILIMFIFKIIYILFWTYILNLICRDKNTKLAWFIFLLPYILLFVILGVVMLNYGNLQIVESEYVV